MARAEQTLMEILRRDEPGLEPEEIFSRSGYRTEHDAMHLLHRLDNAFEPVKGFRRRR